MDAHVELGGSFGALGTFHFCVLSPGIDPRAPIVADAVRRRIPVISEIELGFRFLKCPLIAVTGTNGKTTTTALIAHVLRAAGRNAIAAGNVGYPICDALASEQMPELMVLEVSSFQLEKIERFRPNIAVLLNITPNHLDRYARFEEYAAAKSRLMLNLRECDTLIYKEECADFIAGELEACKASKIRFTAGKPLNGFEFGLCPDGMIVGGIPRSRLDDSRPSIPTRGRIVELASTKLRGSHNAENIMAAAAVAMTFAVPPDVIASAIRNFTPLPHRCEWVATVRGVQFINDSKATSLDAVEKALSAFDAPVVLIAGGRNKGLDFSKLTACIERRSKHLILIGEAKEAMSRAWGKKVSFTQVRCMEEAVRAAYGVARRGEMVLLSPACASFDMFESYEQRGEVFKSEVKKLENELKQTK